MGLMKLDAYTGEVGRDCVRVRAACGGGRAELTNVDKYWTLYTN